MPDNIARFATQAVLPRGFSVGAEVARAASTLLDAAASIGPQIIIAVAMMIASTALGQFKEITNARPKLENAIAGAKQLPDLARMARTDSGVIEIIGYVAQVASGKMPVDAGVLAQLAALARNVPRKLF